MLQNLRLGFSLSMRPLLRPWMRLRRTWLCDLPSMHTPDPPPSEMALSTITGSALFWTTIASPDFNNRWAIMVPAFATHAVIGTGWAWSVVSATIIKGE